MINKHLRILIVDTLHAHSLQIEKMLNRMGYYCIATAGSPEEGMKLSRVGVKRFDVLLAPEHLVKQPRHLPLSLTAYDIENVFIYSRTSANDDAPITARGERYCRSGLPEFLVLEWFMARAKPDTSSCDWAAHAQLPDAKIISNRRIPVFLKFFVL